MPLPSAIADPLEDAFYRLAGFAHTRPRLFTATSVSVVGLLLLVPPAVRSYRGYLALGPGGIPHNLWGWMFQGIGQAFAVRDPRGTADFEKPDPEVLARYGGSARAQKSYLDIDTTLPARQGPRPTVPGYTAPQRQTTDIASPDKAKETRERQQAFLAAVAAANPDILEIRPSEVEGTSTPALWAKNAIVLGVSMFDKDPASSSSSSSSSKSGKKSAKKSTNAKSAVRYGPVEICHAHPEASTHMQFSFGDAYWAVKAGWGERHLLAGSKAARVPPTYLIVYAPRDEKEFKVWKELVMAAVRFSVGDDVDVNDAKK